ncbi:MULTISPECIES: hypothetical protein [Streptomyces]|uniref:hypothetical protein n=1 Tax=Streptomyces TaxID=1883 RepID=UPI00131D3833|nr:hypothetical protein [Streptomyces virginiae]
MTAADRNRTAPPPPSTNSSVAQVILVMCGLDGQVDEVCEWAIEDTSVVWLPVTHSETAATLAETANFLGIPVETIPFSEACKELGHQAAAGTRRREQVGSTDDVRVGKSLVLALGPEAYPTARRFGLLTGRPVIQSMLVPSSKELKGLQGSRSVTVVPPPDWRTRDLIDFLSTLRDSGFSSPVGFLYPLGARIRELFMLKSVLFGIAEQSPSRYRLLYPLEGSSKKFTASDADVIVGRGGGVDDIATLLNTPGDYLFATPHSNGVDMALGDLIMCAREDRSTRTAPPARSLPCFFDAPCSRLNPSRKLFAATRIKSKVVFLYTCWGLMLKDSVYAAEESLGQRFASSPYTAALMTTPALSLLDRAAGLLVGDLLREGRTVGASLNELNKLHFDRYSDTRDVAVLVGDPELCLSAQETSLTRQLASNVEYQSFTQEVGLRPYAIKAAKNLDRTPTEFYAAFDYSRCVAAGTEGLGKVGLTKSARILEARTKSLWASSLTLDARRSQAEIAAVPHSMAASCERGLMRLQDAWIEYFKSLVGTLGGYVRLQSDRYFEPDAKRTGQENCPYCNGAARKIALRLAGATRGRRHIIECASCGTVLDAMAPMTSAVLRSPVDTVQGGNVALTAEISISSKWISRNIRMSAQPIAAVMLLEPFNKAEGATPLSVTLRATASVCSSHPTVHIEFDPLHIPKNLSAGTYYLDGLIMFGPFPTVLRKTITVTQG